MRGKSGRSICTATGEYIREYGYGETGILGYWDTEICQCHSQCRTLIWDA